MARERLKSIVVCEKRNALGGRREDAKVGCDDAEKDQPLLYYCIANHEKEKADDKTDTPWVYQIYLGWRRNSWCLAWSAGSPVASGRGCTGEKARGSHSQAS